MAKNFLFMENIHMKTIYKYHLVHRMTASGLEQQRKKILINVWHDPLKNVSHCLAPFNLHISLSVRSGGLRLTLAGWWATHISATVHFYMATPLCSMRYGTKMCECECVTAFDLWTAPANTQLPDVMVYQILTLTLNWGLLSLYCEFF